MAGIRNGIGGPQVRALSARRAASSDHWAAMPRTAGRSRRGEPAAPRASAGGASNQADLHVAGPATDPQRNLAVGLAMDHEVCARISELEVRQRDLLEERRQAGIAQANLVAGDVELEAERGLHNPERRAAGPGLRRAGDRVERRPAAAA